MPSIITTDIIRYNNPDTPRFLKSHVLHPHTDITIICIVGSAKENVTSVVEDHLLETISSTEWRHKEEDADFSYVTEKYNRFLSNLASADEETVSVIFAVERDGHLMVSSIGESEVILQEHNQDASSIHEDTRGHHRFELISSGDIPINSSVFIVSKNLEGILGDTFYADSASQESTVFAEMTKEVLSRDVKETTHMIRIRRTEPVITQGRNTPITYKGISVIRESMGKIREKIREQKKIRDLREYVQDFFERKHNILLIIFLVIGVILFFALVSYLISALFSVTTGQSQDSKNQIIQAKTLLEASAKLTSNTAAFDATIKDVESILTDLESRQLYVKDIQEIRGKIEAMKKEIYDIQVVNLIGKPSIIPFDAEKISPIGVYEKDKKLYIVGEEDMIWDYALGETTLKMKEYPTGEVARDFAVLDDGNVYILTESNRVIASRKNAEISYVNVTGQDGWELSDGIDIFNGNLYLWNKQQGQIYRHKPGLNGFSQQTPVLSTPLPGILDIGIDGGFYIVKDDQKITRVISNKSQSGLLLNKIPGEYTIGSKANDTQVIIRPELSYVYILDGNRVWIFLPDSKRFQDIKSWTYIAQIELSTTEEIRSIGIARDGLLYVLTDTGLYDLLFEFVDNNIIIRP